MGKRNYNYQLVKIHRNYSVREISELYSIHPHTVHVWVNNDGLCTIDTKKPKIILGQVLFDFLKKRRAKNKQKCKPGEIYCVGCRCPQLPAGNMVEYIPVTKTLGNLQAICPDCDSIINRRINFGRIDEVCGNMDITYQKG